MEAPTVPGMNAFSIEEAAAYLGLSDTALYKMIAKGTLQVLSTERPVRLDSVHVAEVHQALRADALHDLARRRQDPVGLATEVRRILHPRHPPGTGLPGEEERNTQFRMSVLPVEAKTLFGIAALRAAASSGSGCKWCLAREFSAPSAFGGWAPTEWSEAFGALLGMPCEMCRPGVLAPFWEARRRQVYGGAVRPSEPVPRPSAADRERARVWASQRAVTAAAQPVQGDDGRALVSKRRREVQGKLKAANRAGDRAYAEQLARQLEGLRADAAAVDGRTAARPGRLACGHLLAAGCGCPRRASVRGQR